MSPHPEFNENHWFRLVNVLFVFFLFCLSLAVGLLLVPHVIKKSPWIWLVEWLLLVPTSPLHWENAKYTGCVGFCVWEAAGLTSEPAEEVVVMLCRQVGEDVFNPPPKLEAESESEQTYGYFSITSIHERNILFVKNILLCFLVRWENEHR